MKTKGILIPIGGNEDKGIEESEQYTLEFISEGILYHVVKEAGGVYGNIVVIPTASSIPEEVGNNYMEAFGKLGCKNVHVLNIRTKEDAEDPKNIGVIKKANCVMFSGGDQSNITKAMRGTKIHEILVDKYKNENFVIAGTSAGAMCMSQEMITGGSIKEAFTKGAVLMGEGMGFVPNLIIDSHFIRRGRFGRLAEAVARYPKLIGVGLAEDTGLIIRNCNTFEVIGSGMVVIFDPRKIKHNNEKILKVGTPMTLTNLKTHVLANGDQFNIKDRKITVLPVDAPFV